MTGTVPRILKRDQLDGLRRAEAMLREAEAQSQDTRSAAAAEARALLEQAQRRALKESARTASRLIARAEETARARLDGLEPEIARLVALTVRRILGDIEPEAATRAAALNALRQLREHRQGRIFAAPDIAAPIAAAVDAAGPAGPEILSVATDPALDPGRALMISDRGSTELGLAALTEQALRPWTEGSDEAGA
ncbi:HrpE/YscL family type III secretion apparatus protein [Paracoccus contaminans]|uniref:Flagellar assembly protein FliH/Type III secretion system HrpE domain-containing protein n=1 Tax=Paracoccus contaminans TaxID=1945662 RepID=A0A1W6D088_9RHOB|nr:HrpE/YscL family type III secretion apparatus protein [Paracoccus contaminans]ARJ70449.1 hypothetical protein B0A89_13185 [Paracoccus contaminans]